MSLHNSSCFVVVVVVSIASWFRGDLKSDNKFLLLFMSQLSKVASQKVGVFDFILRWI